MYCILCLAPDKRNTSLFIDTSQTPPAPPKRLVKKVSGSATSSLQLPWLYTSAIWRPQFHVILFITEILLCVIGHYIFQKK